MVGALAFPGGNDGTSPTVSGIMGFCGGSTLAMIGSTVLPEAFEQAPSLLSFIMNRVLIPYLYHSLRARILSRAATSSASRASSNSSLFIIIIYKFIYLLLLLYIILGRRHRRPRVPRRVPRGDVRQGRRARD